jgi:hypothetical protein
MGLSMVIVKLWHYDFRFGCLKLPSLKKRYIGITMN